MADSQKRPHEEELPTFDDPADLVNAVISTLQLPEEKTYVSMNFANDKNLATEVQAYAKIAGRDWTYYVKLLGISIGRNTENPPNPSQHLQNVDIDLGPAKVVSRQHAVITYNIELRCWELKVLGRNGARIDTVKMPVGAEHATPLHSGAILDIGGTQMMFILPDAPPSILQKMLTVCLARYKQDMHKMPHTSTIPNAGTMMNMHNQGMAQFLGITNFQMFDKAHLAHSPSSVSAVSLQNNLDQDLSKEEAKDIKPPYSYATMITQAILSNADGVMSLSEIYTWISSHYAYYKYSKTGWQNSIRHNLSLNKAFEKVPRRPNEPGKGMKWQISESYKEDFLKKIQSGTLLKSRRGSSVSRTLQIHLATHQQLPESQTYFKPEMHSRGPSFDHPIDNDPNIIQKVNQPMPYTSLPASHMQSNSMNYQPNMSLNGYPLAYGAHYGQQGPMMYQQQQHLVPGDKSNELASPLKPSTMDTNTPKLPKVGGAHMFNLPPPSSGSNHPASNSDYSSGMNIYKNPSASHLQGNTETSSTADGPSSFANTSNHLNPSESMQSNSTAPTTSNTSDLGLGFTSPKKIAPMEAFTPERGSKAVGPGGKVGMPNGNINQSSPAFWNFVQFSTPNGQTPGRKDSAESNGQGSPTLNRKTNLNNGESRVLSSGSQSKLSSSREELPDDSPGGVK